MTADRGGTTMQTVIDSPEVTIYTAWYGYSQCDPLATIAGTDFWAVEKAVQAAMDEEEERSKESCDDDHTEENPEDDCPWCNPTIVWSGTIWRETLEAFREYCGIDKWAIDDLLNGQVVYVSP